MRSKEGLEKMETLAFLYAHGKDTEERSDSEYRREKRWDDW